jgi:hypothetical protein
LITSVVFVSGCGRGPATAHQPVAIELAKSAEQRPVGATGVPIDASKKTVVVSAAPPTGTPQQMKMQLQAQQQKTEAQLAKLMNSYSGNINNSRAKEKLTLEMSGQMEAYKRQALSLYRMQRAEPQANATSDHTEN